MQILCEMNCTDCRDIVKDAAAIFTAGIKAIRGECESDHALQ